ncbi:MAG: hypothetical protein V4689_11210 [Verrucomicrobiota bacterium]
MTARFPLLTLAMLGAAADATFAGAPAEPAAPEITAASTPSRWRFGAAYAPLVGLKVDFKGLGKFNSPFTAQPLGGGVDYEYEDGFVRVDSADNLGGQTWNWGYQDNSQYQSANGGSVDFSITNSLSNGSAEEDSNANLGVELTTYYDMGAVGIPGLKERGATWGFRGGLHYARINVENNNLISTDLTTLTDRFNLNGAVAPGAPYAGSFEGPGPLIDDSPIRSISAGGQGLIAGSRTLDIHLTTLNFGGYLEVPVTRKFDLLLEAGVSAAVASGSYEFDSYTSVNGVNGTTSQTSAGKDSGNTVLPGAYLGMGGIYQLTPNWALQASGRFQYMDDLDLGDNGSSAELSFGSAFVISVGALYSF